MIPSPLNRRCRETALYRRLEPYAGKLARTVLRGENDSNVVFLLDGYKATTSLLNRKAKQYPSHYTSSRMNRYKQDIRDKKVVCDCIGGAKGYAWTNGGQAMLDAIGTDSAISNKYGANGCPDKSANSMFSWAKSKGMDWGAIDTLPEIVGLALHTDGHVGYYVGNGYVVEWRGFNYGCVSTKVKDRKWKYWYKLPFIQYGEAVADDDGQPEIPERPTQDAPTLVGTTVVIVSEGGKVNVRCGNGKEYERLCAVAPGSTFPLVATAQNGWRAVEIGPRVGWVSGEFARII